MSFNTDCYNPVLLSLIAPFSLKRPLEEDVENEVMMKFDLHPIFGVKVIIKKKYA